MEYVMIPETTLLCLHDLIKDFKPSCNHLVLPVWNMQHKFLCSLAKPGHQNIPWSLRPFKHKIREIMEALLHWADWVGRKRKQGREEEGKMW